MPPDSMVMCSSNPRIDGRPWEPWEGNGPCQDCDQPNVVWFTDNEVWNAVMDGETVSVVCPSCFIKRAFATGLLVVWKLAPESEQPTTSAPPATAVTDSPQGQASS